jgi:hypothetical protein
LLSAGYKAAMYTSLAASMARTSALPGSSIARLSIGVKL